MNSERHPRMLAALAGLVFLAGALSHLAAPLVEWDHVYLSAAEAWSRGVNAPWIFDHPPLYTMGLAVVFLLGGPSVLLGRLANLACLLATAALIVRVTGRIASPRAGWWAAAIFLLSPLVIQGAKSFDGADTTLMPLVFMVWLMVVESAWRKPRKSAWEAIGFATALCFWAKATATVALIAGTAACLAWAGGQEARWRRHLIKGVLFGAAVFIFTWSVVSLVLWGPEACWVTLMTPVRAFVGNATGLGLPAKISRIGLDCVRLLFWLSPFLLLMAAGSIRELWQTRQTTRHPVTVLLAWIAVIYVAVFLGLRGTQWNFPRYHVAIMPFACILAGMFCHATWSGLAPEVQRRGLWLAGGLAVLTSALLDDPLLFFTVAWKEALLAGNLGAILPRGLAHAAAFLVLPWLISRLLLKHARAAAIVALLAAYGALDLTHLRAPYMTGYQYGGWGKPEVLELVSSMLQPHDAVLATPEFLYDFRRYEVPRVPMVTWHAIDTVAKAVEASPRVIILGMTTQTLETWREFARHPGIQQALAARYRRHDVGTYRVWIRDG